MVTPMIEEAAMSDTPQTFQKADKYDFRMPTPPRIIIPPLGTWSVTGEVVPFGSIISHPDPALNIDFLDSQEFAAHGSQQLQSLRSWKYEDRREAQAILPYLYLGPLHAARDKDFLQREGFTMILAVQHRSGFGAKLTTGAMRVADELGIVRETIESANGQDLIAAFPNATRLINSHLRELYNRAQLNPHGGIPHGKVLVFCESGNEKSAAIVAAYLMDNFQGFDNVKACQVCNSRRFCCSFDDTIKNYLQTYSDILTARRSVQAVSPPVFSLSQSNVTNPFFGAPPVLAPQPVNPAPTNFVNGKAKRGRERDDDDDMMDVNAVEDEDRFLGREYAPFR